jgi:hypothetical protein
MQLPPGYHLQSETREGVGIAAKVVEAHDEDILGELEDVIRCVRVILGVGRGRVNLDFGYDCGFVKLAEFVESSIIDDHRGRWGTGRAHVVRLGGGLHSVWHEPVCAAGEDYERAE